MFSKTKHSDPHASMPQQVTNQLKYWIRFINQYMRHIKVGGILFFYEFLLISNHMPHDTNINCCLSRHQHLAHIGCYLMQFLIFNFNPISSKIENHLFIQSRNVTKVSILADSNGGQADTWPSFRKKSTLRIKLGSKIKPKSWQNYKIDGETET